MMNKEVKPLGPLGRDTRNILRNPHQSLANETPQDTVQTLTTSQLYGWRTMA